MSFDHKTIIFILMWLLPFMIIGIRNHFESKVNTFIRFIISVFVLWAYVLICRQIVDAVDLSLATTDEARQRIFDGDGAKNVFALFFGWVPGIFFTTIAWLSLKVFYKLKEKSAKKNA